LGLADGERRARKRQTRKPPASTLRPAKRPSRQASSAPAAKRRPLARFAPSVRGRNLRATTAICLAPVDDCVRLICLGREHLLRHVGGLALVPNDPRSERTHSRELLGAEARDVGPRRRARGRPCWRIHRCSIGVASATSMHQRPCINLHAPARSESLGRCQRMDRTRALASSPCCAATRNMASVADYIGWRGSCAAELGWHPLSWLGRSKAQRPP
jgi:hypothetical protein